MIRVVVTGAGGLLGWHAAARLHASNCAAKFAGNPENYDLITLDHTAFDDDTTLNTAVKEADVVLHFAGVNRGEEAFVKAANPEIATRLVDACRSVGATPHIVYANSTHAAGNTPYGHGKARAAQVLARSDGGFTDLILPHVFGEEAKPHYNNVTATLVDQITNNVKPEVNPNGSVNLLHAGVAAKIAIEAGLSGQSGQITPQARHISVPDLCAKLQEFHENYSANIYPTFSDSFDVALFNTYRTASYPNGWPRPLKLHSDSRGVLFEAIKGGSGGQAFLSTTLPGVTRGDHFHLKKVERFLVVQGEAVIRLRRVLHDEVLEYRVFGDRPAIVDIPTLYSHSIENVSDEPLTTLFWTNEMFDPKKPDTFADKVLV